MPGSAQNSVERDRLDHILPQGYLNGFTNPDNDGQISVFDCQRQQWFDSGAAGVAAIRGFYDYPEGIEHDQTADQAFRDLERKFPVVRRALVASKFSGFVDQLDFLLTFAQMLRARSELFREQALVRARQLKILRIEEIHQEESTTQPGTIETALKVKPYIFENETEREKWLKSKTITDMRTEISNGPSWFSQLNWCLQFTEDHTNPLVTAENPVLFHGTAPTLYDALTHSETLVFFPICWQACLIGSPVKFDREIDTFDSGDLRRLRALYLKAARRFVYSPACLDF